MAGTEENCEPTTDSSVYPSGGCTLNGCSADRAAGDRTIFNNDVLVHIFREDRRVLPRRDVGDVASRNTDQDGDLPVRVVLPQRGTFIFRSFANSLAELQKIKLSKPPGI